MYSIIYLLSPALHEKCPNTEFFLFRIFPHSDWTRIFSVFSSNGGKYGPDKTPCLDTFHAVPIFFLTNFRSSHLQIFLKKFHKNLWNLVPSPLKRDPWAGVPLTILWFFAEHLFKEYFLLRWYLSNETLSIFWKTHIRKNRIFEN